jgi:hypothetical protein
MKLDISKEDPMAKDRKPADEPSAFATQTME